jgi:hypothetical protein
VGIADEDPVFVFVFGYVVHHIDDSVGPCSSTQTSLKRRGRISSRYKAIAWNVENGESAPFSGHGKGIAAAGK